MVVRIGGVDESAGWTRHIAWVHLRMDTQRLTADLAGGAEPQVIATDRAMLTESRDRTGTRRLVDVTV
jgi:hypothetical protein